MWDWFITFLTNVLAGIEGFCGDWGLAIIILTFIIRILLTPLMVRSTASSARMQAMQPRMLEIQEKYADDPVKQQEELQKLYADANFNPLGGCLPVFLQMPIFFALFSTLRDQLPQIAPDACFYNILPSLSSSVTEMVSSVGALGAWVYILFDILFGVLTFIPMVMNLKNSAPEQRSQTLTMGIVMSVMMIWFGISVPAGVLLYYNTSAIWQVVQAKFITQRVMEDVKAKEEERLANQPVKVDVVRRERKQRPHKKK